MSYEIERIADLIKRLLCKLGWHSVGKLTTHPDDPLHFLVYAKCRWCHYKGQIDSQGNLF